MKRCLELASHGWPNTHPNPLVGSVVVHDEKIIGEGYHQKYGAPHAEVQAIKHIADNLSLKGSTLYVNLEPCAHHGKTPPCTDLIIEKGIGRVVCAMEDPNPMVAGLGIQKLRDAGIEVVCGVLKNQALHINRSFATFHQKNRPHIVLKWAETADGFMGRAPEDHSMSRQISGDLSNIFVHQLRAESSAIVIGSQTAIDDNPGLNTRLWTGPDPKRVIFDVQGRLPSDLSVFNDGRFTAVIGQYKSTNANVQLISCGADEDAIDKLVEWSNESNHIQILVEGGAFTIQSFIQKNIWDEAYVITSKNIWQRGIESPKIGFEPVKISNLDKDTLRHFVNETS